MKNLKQISMASVLILMLVTGAFAGIIHTPALPPPPDAPLATEPGIIHTGSETPSSQQNSAAPDDGFAEIVMSLVHSVLAAF